jgi:hypothetical protein
MIGGGFHHSPSSSGNEPLHIKWIKGERTAKVSIHIDYEIKNVPDKGKENYGWLSESRDINGNLYEWCRKNVGFLEANYKLVFTHDISLLPISNIFALYLSGKSFIPELDGRIYDKTKLVSMIASSKKSCPAHLYRHKMIEKFRGKCDHFGRGFNELSNKIDGLKEYCFSITMENGNYPNMISEKITDCFMTGTIPVFYGIKNIGDFFDSNGIIELNDEFMIEDLSWDLYYSKMDSIKNNFKTAMNMLVAEDYIYLKYIKNEI